MNFLFVFKEKLENWTDPIYRKVWIGSALLTTVVRCTRQNKKRKLGQDKEWQKNKRGKMLQKNKNIKIGLCHLPWQDENTKQWRFIQDENIAGSKYNNHCCLLVEFCPKLSYYTTGAFEHFIFMLTVPFYRIFFSI